MKQHLITLAIAVAVVWASNNNTTIRRVIG